MKKAELELGHERQVRLCQQRERGGRLYFYFDVSKTQQAKWNTYDYSIFCIDILGYYVYSLTLL